MVWLQGTGKSEHDLKDRLVTSGYQVKLRHGDPEDPISRSLVVEDQHDNRVDLLMGVRGMDPEASGRCVSVSPLDSSVCIIAVEDLIPMKISAGGIQDLEDVRGILQVSGTLLNLDLLRKLAAKYGAAVARRLEALLKESFK